MILLFTLLEILVIFAIIVVLGVFIIVSLLKAGASKVSGGTNLPPAGKQLRFIIPPPKQNEPDVEFEKNTPFTFTVKLERFVSGGTQRWEAYGEQESLVGIVEPDTVQVIKINNEDPGDAEQRTGLSVKAYKTKSKSDGTITIVLKGSEPADGKLSVFYVESATSVAIAHADFLITDE
jgi:hypothetical protein